MRTTPLHRATSAAKEEGLRESGSDGVGHANRYMKDWAETAPSMGGIRKAFIA